MGRYIFFIFLFFIFNGNSFGRTKKESLKYNQKAPIRIVSDKAIVKKKSQLMFFIGNVNVKQDTMRLNSDNMKIKYKETSDSKLDIIYIEARDNVKMNTRDIFAIGDYAYYDVKKNEIKMTGNVIIKEETNVIHAENFVYNVLTEETNISAKEGERVTIILEDIKSIEKKIEENE